MATHRSRVCQIVIDVSDLDQGVTFWTAALDGDEEETSETSRKIYRRIRLPDSEIRILLQKTGDRKISKERMHIDLETDNVEAEVERLEALGAVRWDHQQERGFDFWVLRDPWGNEFCVLQEEFPELLANRRAWSATPSETTGGRDADLAYMQVAEDIAARVVSGELKPGSRLRAERELAEHYGVAYGTVRHAMGVLRERGLITTIYGRGTFVSAPGADQPLDPAKAQPWRP